MNLTTLLEERARLHPQRVALVDSLRGRDRSVTFAELSGRVTAGASRLHEMGLRRGQVVLVFQPVSIELYEFLLASFGSGIRVMLADPSAGKEFLSLCCQRLMPDAFFGSWKAQCLRLAVPALRRIDKAIVGGPWFPGAMKWRADRGNMPMVAVPDDEPALVTFTSGSTGVPKAAVRTHGFLLAQHRELSQSLGFEEDGETDLITLPVFVLANLASGLTSVLAATDLARPGTPDVEAIRAQCARHGVTRCTASPAFFEGLLKSNGMPEFRKIFTGGAPVFPDLLRRLSAALPDAAIHSVYGSTEAEPICHFSADEADVDTEAITRRGGGLCAGVPVPAIQVRIIADHWGESLGRMDMAEFSRLEIPAGQAGEIVVAGDHVLGGYLDGIGDDETKIHVDGGVWHRTGDAGWIDAAGRLWLLGRCAAKLPSFAAPAGIPAEALRYPFAIECALREKFPEIRTAAIEWRGKRLLSVGKQMDTDETETLRRMASELGMEKLVCLDALPMDRRHNAKIDYPALRELLEQRVGLE